jgi:hypothetical protein
MFGEKNTKEGIFTLNRDIIKSNGSNTSIERFVLFAIVRFSRTGLLACILCVLSGNSTLGA